MPNSEEIAELRSTVETKFSDIWKAVDGLREAHNSHQIEWAKHITGLSFQMRAMRGSLDRLDTLVAYAIRVMIFGIIVIAAAAGPQGIATFLKLIHEGAASSEVLKGPEAVVGIVAVIIIFAKFLARLTPSKQDDEAVSELEEDFERARSMWSAPGGKGKK